MHSASGCRFVSGCLGGFASDVLAVLLCFVVILLVVVLTIRLVLLLCLLSEIMEATGRLLMLVAKLLVSPFGRGYICSSASILVKRSS